MPASKVVHVDGTPFKNPLEVVAFADGNKEALAYVS